MKPSNGPSTKLSVPTAKPLPKPLPKPAPPPMRYPDPVIPADKDLSSKSTKGLVKDRIFLMVPDPHWLHVHWELTMQSVKRAEAALGQEWYGAKPVLRLFDVTSQDTTSTAEAPIRDIAIHGGVSHWYIDVTQPPRTYRVDIGYITRRGYFHPLCRSNVVTPPKAGDEVLPEGTPPPDLVEKPADRGHAADTHDDPLHRGSKDVAAMPDKLKKFGFEIGAELIVTGRTDPAARVTLQNEPVKIRTDGTFTMRYSLTDGRQIIPAVATSSDGMEERTIVLAVERNTKQLDPMVHDLYNVD